MHTVFFKKDKDGKLFDCFGYVRGMKKKPLSEEDCIKFINKPNVILFGKNVEGSLVYGVFP
jgi:hypothetical protein